MHTAGTDPLYPVHSLSLNAEYTLHFHAEAPGPVLYSPAKGLHHPPSLCGIFSYILIPFIARPTHTVKHIPPVSGVKCDSNEKEPFCQACRHPFLLRCRSSLLQPCISSSFFFSSCSILRSSASASCRFCRPSFCIFITSSRVKSYS